MIGPRQVGKTTLAKQLQTCISKESIYLDLESQEDYQKLINIESYLRQREDKLIIVDEVQRMPELFPVLRYYTNISKRLVKSPKLYIRDSGLLHAVVRIENEEDLEGYVGKGSSWEGFVIQEVVAQLRSSVSAWYYRTQDGSELDLVLVKGINPILGIEIKYASAPKITKGTTVASQDLGDFPYW